MKILIITPYLPHPKSGHGGGTYLYHLLNNLSKRHHITLASFVDDRELALVNDLKQLPIDLHFVHRKKGRDKNFFSTFKVFITRALRLIQSVLLWEPYYISKFKNHQMAELVAHLTSIERFDVVQIEYTQMGSYVKFIKHGKTVLHEHDVVYRPAYRAYKNSKSVIKKLSLFLEWCRCAAYEPKMTKQFDYLLTSSEQDQNLLRRITGIDNIDFVPFGVDVAKCIPDFSIRKSNSLLFVGSFSHRPNIDSAFWLLEEIFPQLQKKFPATILYIAGANPPEQLRALCANVSNVKLLGFVDDIIPYFRECGIFIAPLRSGGGVKIKILQAMAQGIPIVTTKVGIEGIEAIYPNAVLVGNTSQEIVNHIGNLLSDTRFSSLLGLKGWEIMNKYYSWESIIAKHEILYNNICNT